MGIKSLTLVTRTEEALWGLQCCFFPLHCFGNVQKKWCDGKRQIESSPFMKESWQLMFGRQLARTSYFGKIGTVI